MNFDNLRAPLARMLAADPADFITVMDALDAFAELELPASPAHNALAAAVLQQAVLAGLIVPGELDDEFHDLELHPDAAAARIAQSLLMAQPYTPGRANDDQAPGLYQGSVAWFRRTPLGDATTAFISRHVDLLGGGFLRPLPIGPLTLEATSGWPLTVRVGNRARVQAQCVAVWIDLHRNATTLACDLRSGVSDFRRLLDARRVDAAHVHKDGLLLRTDAGMFVLKPRPDTLTHWIAEVDGEVVGAAFAPFGRADQSR